MRWAEEQLPENRKEVTVSLDGKTVRSTGKMDSYESPLHVVSAQLCELGITFGSKSVEVKSNEIPAVQELLRELEISGCMVVADALQCQKRRQKQLLMEKETICLAYKATRKPWRQISQTMCRTLIYEKIWTQMSKKRKTGAGLRSEQHLHTDDVGWIPDRQAWSGLCCIGAIHTEFEEKGKKTSEWHYYISSRKLTALELLHHTRMEWSVESMHWLLDVHFSEDFCRVEDKNVQQNLNILRKFALSIIKSFKTTTPSKRPFCHEAMGSQ